MRGTDALVLMKVGKLEFSLGNRKRRDVYLVHQSNAPIIYSAYVPL